MKSFIVYYLKHIAFYQVESELEKYLRRTQSTISDGMYEYRQDNIILLLTELYFRSSGTDKYFTGITRRMSYSKQELLNIGEIIGLSKALFKDDT